uniref:Uncharacterized protein n=1 Tax=Lactuca sativa TaxID=4236 RepID=A0A9R1ULE0_LACSA|nr:hypothetical protein LSAT_V11C800392050 [Lactuca sativa]
MTRRVELDISLELHSNSASHMGGLGELYEDGQELDELEEQLVVDFVLVVGAAWPYFFKLAVAVVNCYMIICLCAHGCWTGVGLRRVLLRAVGQHTQGGPGVTRFSSAFLTLQSLSEKNEQLKNMFFSNEWEEYKFFGTPKGRALYEIVTRN